MKFDRRTVIAGVGALATLPARVQAAKRTADPRFPQRFLWGVATAGHQVEGNNTSSDIWLLEHVRPTVFAEPSGDAVNNFDLWREDLDLVKSLGLNTYRFSLEWSRIEPERGQFSQAMLDHYKAIIEGCNRRGLTPMVTFNHFTTPRWFATLGGWTASEAPQLFADFCDRAARQLASDIGYATTLNEPNILTILAATLPPEVLASNRKMLEAAAAATGSGKFSTAIAANPEDLPLIEANLVKAHKAGRAAIKASRPELPVGVSIAVMDDQAVGKSSIRDAMRQTLYGAWFEAVAGDDFLGVQNYERSRWDAKGRLAPPANATRNFLGAEVYPPSLAGAVRYAHSVTKLPIIVTEHGVGTGNDAVRADLIVSGLSELKRAIDEGIPVLGYVHWSLLDNYEWVFGYKPQFGLVAVDRSTFKRAPKPSASVLGAIARANRLGN